MASFDRSYTCRYKYSSILNHFRVDYRDLEVQVMVTHRSCTLQTDNKTDGKAISKALRTSSDRKKTFNNIIGNLRVA